MELEKLKFLNGPSTVYKESRFVYLKQCGLYVEEYNVSKVRKSDPEGKIRCLQVAFTKRAIMHHHRRLFGNRSSGGYKSSYIS